MTQKNTSSIHPVDYHVGRRLRELRNKNRLSQQKLGEMLDITFQQIQKYEKGVNRICASRLYEISKLLGEDVSFFYENLDFDIEERMAPYKENTVVHHAFYDQVDKILPEELEALLKAFREIDNPLLRKQILELMKTLGKGKSPGFTSWNKIPSK